MARRRRHRRVDRAHADRAGPARRRVPAGRFRTRPTRSSRRRTSRRGRASRRREPPRWWSSSSSGRRSAGRPAARPWTGHPGTLGLAERDLVAAAALRWAPVAGAALAGWRAPRPRPSVRSVLRGEACGHGPSTLDWTVVLVGSVGVFVLVMVVGASSGVRHRAADSSAPAIGSASIGRPSLQAGLGLAWRGAARRHHPAARVGGARLGRRWRRSSPRQAGRRASGWWWTSPTASERHGTHRPVRAGGPRPWPGWRTWRGIDHAAVLGGTDVSTPGDSSLWVQAFRPVAGVPLSEPSVVEGRHRAADRRSCSAPSRCDEPGSISATACW